MSPIGARFSIGTGTIALSLYQQCYPNIVTLTVVRVTVVRVTMELRQDVPCLGAQFIKLVVCQLGIRGV